MKYFALFLKGVAMGAANVIPGVSGGTIAFITNIYEELIDSLKSFDLQALKLLASFKIKELLVHINFNFLLAVFAGAILTIFGLGSLLKGLFSHYPVLIWAFFFGLIVASVYFVGKTVGKWNTVNVIMLFLGTAVAVAISFLNPAQENDAFMYLLLCGVIAIASMILPGLSGSYILILLGNYQLVFLKAVPDINFKILAPVAIGAGLGFIALSRVISFLLKKFKDQTIAVLTGFILGSLLIIWPWKSEVYLKDSSGQFILKKGEKIIQSYDWFMPEWADPQTLMAIGLMIAGAAVIYWIETLGSKSANNPEIS